MPEVTALYAGLLGLLFILLAVQIGQLRAATSISIGDAGNDELVIAMRRQANFVEFVPLALILIGLLESNGVSAAAVHALGATLLVARACHAYGFRAEHPGSVFRSIGAIGSTLTMAVASVWAIVIFF
jgi:uncharacterized membrane protein YecN with MAPEG domain